MRVEPSRAMSWAASSEPWRLLLTYFFLPACACFTIHFTVHECSRMFSQQINTTFDTSLLCPQRNRINSRSSHSYTSCLPASYPSCLPALLPTSCVLRLVMVSKVLAHSSSSSTVCGSGFALWPEGSRLKPAWLAC